jgi:hypothetical protein
MVQLIQTHDLGVKGAAITTLTWNVLFVMLLPMVMDWCESYYFKARFMKLEEIANTNPELANVISKQCEDLSIPGVRFAVVDNAPEDLFSYGLWRMNPRLVISGKLLDKRVSLVPSIEAELSRFATQDHTFVFVLFAIVQIIMQQLLIAFVHI